MLSVPNTNLDFDFSNVNEWVFVDSGHQGENGLWWLRKKG